MAQPIRKLSNKWRVDTLRESTDPATIRYALFRNSDVPMSRCIVYFQGRAEWIEKNMELPDSLALPADCGFLTLDHRGQGASGGERAYIDSYDTYVDDAKRVIDAELGNLPFAVLAHSMGGLIAVYGNLTDKIHPHSMALSAPLFQIPNDPMPRPMSRVAASILTKVGWGKVRSGAGRHEKTPFERNRLTHDYEMFQIVKNSPYYVPSATFGWVTATFAAIDFIYRPENLQKLSAPTLVFSPSEERVVDPVGHTTWVAAASQNAKVEVNLALIHGSKHELFSEVPDIRKQVISKTKDWFRDFLS